MNQLNLYTDELAEANSRLDDALRVRVSLHRGRAAGELTVAEYLAGLRWVRAVEAELDPVRRRHGCRYSRA